MSDSKEHYVTKEEEDKPLCTSEFSDMVPLTGGNVLFTTLEGRPSKDDFENSAPLQVSVEADLN